MGGKKRGTKASDIETFTDARLTPGENLRAVKRVD